MRVSLIVAMANHRVIGKDNKLPWHLPADLQHFKKTTWGKPIIMGRKCFESIGKALPGRRNIIITRQQHYSAEHCEIMHSLPAAIDILKNEAEIMIIGGGEIYQQAIAMAHRLYITKVDADVEGDVYFPAWDDAQWQQMSNEPHAADQQNPYDYCFMVLDRKH